MSKATEAERSARSRARPGLSIEDRLKFLVPSWLYFAHKTAKEQAEREPELQTLRDNVRPGCTAIDVGANRGVYSYALSQIAKRVEAFEPNPSIAAFARAKLGRRVRVHQVALSDRAGSATFYVPRTAAGNQAHLLGSLGNFHRIPNADQIEVTTATLDSYGFDDVGFIKIDAEGSELNVISGARRTIMRDRPTMLVELLMRPDDEVLAAIERIETEFNYDPWIMDQGARKTAREMLRASRKAIKTRNVLFTPR